MKKQLVLIFLITLFSGCDEITNSIFNYQEFEFSAVNYSDNHFLADTSYKSSFLEVFNTTTPNSYSANTENNSILTGESFFEVWMQTDTNNADKRFAVATAFLYEEPVTGYPDSLKNTSSVVGKRYPGFFRKLAESEYTVHNYAGMIIFKVNIPGGYAAAITYRTRDGRKFGTPSTALNIGLSDTLILKMIKAPYLDPITMPDAWELKLKNIYRLPAANIQRDGFKLDVMYKDQTGLKLTLPGMQTTLSTITKIDSYTGSTRMPPPDGEFDYLPFYTIYAETGDIIFPSFRPFYDEISSHPGGSNYAFPEIYTQTRSVAFTQPNAVKYFIKGRYKQD